MKLSLLALSGVALLALGGVPAQDPPAPADELAALVRTLRTERAAHAQRRRELDNRIEDLRLSIGTLEAEAADAKARRDENARALEEVRAEVARLKAAETETARLRGAVARTLEEALPRARRALDGSPPFRFAERLARLEGDGGADDAAGRLWRYLQEELRYARSGESAVDTIALPDGRLQHARFVRVGHAFLAYVTEDGLGAGLWDGKAWNHAPTPEARAAVKSAVEILTRRRLPEWLPLPVPAAGGRP